WLRRAAAQLARSSRPPGLASADRLPAAIAEQLRLPHVRSVQVHRDVDAARMLSESLCRQHRLVPIHVVDETLVVAMADPLDPDAAAALREASPLPTRIVVASDVDIEMT